MSGFESPGGEHKFSDDACLSGIWVSSTNAEHVGLTFVDVGDAIPYGEASNPKKTDKVKDLADPDAPSNVWTLHLSGAKVLQDVIDWDTTAKQYLVAPTRLDEEHRKTFPTYAANVVLNAKASAIPFGIDWLGSKGTIDGNGLFIPKTGAEGFTCATFICEVFRGFGLKVANPEDWDPREEETEVWRAQLIAGLRANGNTPEATIQRIVDANPIVRLKPTEMAAGGSLPQSNWPISAAGVADLVEQILADFKNAYPSKGQASATNVLAEQAMPNDQGLGANENG